MALAIGPEVPKQRDENTIRAVPRPGDFWLAVVTLASVHPLPGALATCLAVCFVVFGLAFGFAPSGLGARPDF
jgi:hypothetical protein